MEVLVILDKFAPLGTRERIAAGSRMTQAASDRVFVLRQPVPPSPLVEQVLTGTESAADLPSTLSPAETLFAKAWLVSHKEKIRPGDGLPWDAPGFKPPDPD